MDAAEIEDPLDQRRKPAQNCRRDKSSPAPRAGTAKNRRRACVILSIATYLSLVGCGAQPAAQPKAGASDAGLAPGEEFTPVMQGLEASATDLGQDHMLVELKQADGRTQFKADFMPDGAQYRVTHELYAAGVTEAPPQRGQWMLPREPGQALTHKSAIEGTLFLYQNLKTAAAGNYSAQDHYGCDLGPLGSKSSCSDVGACCDIQDQCYQDNGCTAASWNDKNLNSACHKNCNVPALSCVLLQKPGKSSCCEKGADYCGQTRVPGEPKPTAATPATTPRWDGVEQWNGTGSQPSTKKTGKKSTGNKPSAPSGKAPGSMTNAPSSPSAGKPKTPSSPAASTPSSSSKPMASTPSSPSKSPAKSPSTAKKPGSKMPKSDSQSNQAKAAGRPDAGMIDSVPGEDDEDDDDGYDDDNSDRSSSRDQADDDDDDDDDDYPPSGRSCDPYYGCDDDGYCDPYNDPFCDSDSASSDSRDTGSDDDDDDDDD